MVRNQTLNNPIEKIAVILINGTVVTIHVPIGATLIMYGGNMYKAIYATYDGYSNPSELFIQVSGELEDRYWNCHTGDWGNSKEAIPGYTLSIQRAQELLAEQDKKIAELLDINRDLVATKRQIEQSNNDLCATIKKLRDESKRLNSSLTSWMKEHSAIGLENVRLENALHEIAESATRAAKSKANQVDSVKINGENLIGKAFDLELSVNDGMKLNQPNTFKGNRLA